MAYFLLSDFNHISSHISGFSFIHFNSRSLPKNQDSITALLLRLITSSLLFAALKLHYYPVTMTCMVSLVILVNIVIKPVILMVVQPFLYRAIFCVRDEMVYI